MQWPPATLCSLAVNSLLLSLVVATAGSWNVLGNSEDVISTYHSKQHSENDPASAFQKLVRKAASKHSAVMLTIASKHGLVGYLPSMLTSLAMTPKSEDTIRSILIVVMSEDDLKLCQLLHSQCWLDDFSVVPDVPLPENAHFPDWQPRSSARLGWRRVDYANAILSMGVGVFILDLDLLFYDNPFLLLQDPKYANLDFFSQSELGQSSSDAASSGDVNIGFSYFAAKNSTRQLISEWMRHRSVWDQGALQMLLRDKVVPELQWATLPSKVSHSLCHLRLGHKWDPNDKRQHQGHPLFQTQYYDHLVHNAEHYKGLITFHFPCCSGPLPHWVCKSLMMALALHARVDNEVSFINKISDTAANLFSG